MKAATEDLYPVERLGFLNIDDVTRRTLNDLRQDFAGALPGIADELYVHLQKWPALSEILGGSNRIAHLKKAQQEHWSSLFSGLFEDSYFVRTLAVGRAHETIGLEPRWFMGSYCFVLERLLATLLPKKAMTPDARRKLGAVLRAAFLDMDLAVTAYVKNSEAGKLKREMLELSDVLEQEVSASVNIISVEADRMTQGAETLTTISARLHETATAVDYSTKTAIGNVQSVAGATEELDASSRQIAAQVEEAARLTEAAVGQARTANDMVGGLSAAVGRIDEVVTLVETIAAQTKLLALNATIEAARAGDAGRGFGVVADEVKSLARQTEEAIRTIRTQSEAIRGAAKETMQIVRRVTDDIQSINGVATGIAESTEQQRQATSEISRSAVSAAEQVQSVGNNAVSVLEESTSTGATAESVRKNAMLVSSNVRGLQDRLSTILRHSYAGDRRQSERYPVAASCRVQLGAFAQTSQVIDLSPGGALIAARADKLASDQEGRIDIDGIGSLAAKFITSSDFGMHLRFLAPSAEQEGKLREAIERAMKADKPHVALCQQTAARVVKVFEEALASRAITPAALFDEEYVPIKGTDPLQYTARCTDFCDRALPAILEPVLQEDRRVKFCIAVDRNGYAPTHNAKYSQPQKPDDRSWNVANCRNRRIFNDRTGMLSARNTREILVQIYRRDLGADGVMLLKEMAAPIMIGERLWGNVRLGLELS